MPSFDLTAGTAAPVEEVWKLLYDPSRFPEWWAGIETVRTGEPGQYTVWPQGFPDFPMAQQLSSDHEDSRVTISCLVSDLVFRWQLYETPDGTRIEVHVELPEAEAARLPTQHAVIKQSLERLADLAMAM